MVAPFKYDLWNSDPIREDDNIQVHCFMPNGNYILFHCPTTLTLFEMKEELWEEAEKYPLFGHLRNKAMYVIKAIKSPSALLEEIIDESQRICDVQPYFALFRISERLENESEDINLNKNINSLIGKKLDDFRTLKNPEVNDFRYHINVLGEQIANRRSKMTLKEKILYQYPPKLAKISEIPHAVQPVLRENNEFQIVAKLSNENISTITLQVSCFINPSQLLEQIILKKQSKLKNYRGKMHDYILKICGQEEYIFGDFPLIQFLYIQDRLSRGEMPMVVVTYVTDVYVFTSNTEILEKNQPKKQNKGGGGGNTSTLRKKGKNKTTWEVDDNFQITINTIYNLNIDANKTVEIGIQAGIFHGGKSLCEKQNTEAKKAIENENNKAFAEWNETLKFDLKVCNIPRMARLCLVVYEVARNAKHVRARRLKDTQKDLFINPLYFVNTTLFDYKSQFKNGGQTLYSWTYSEDSDSDELLHPFGTLEPNPRTRECAHITMIFHSYHNNDMTVVYPNKREIHEYAEQHFQKQTRDDAKLIENIIQPYLHNDRISDISEQERKEIWERRYDLITYVPDGLPCLLHCVEWNNRYEVAEIIRMLSDWPQMSIERSLELLDYAYADSYVRRFAVECLKKIQDEDLQLYLLQLVQAIKHEPYLYCDLVEFLLQRALNNQRIGHFLFWHLRSEIQVPSVEVRFSLILEAYLRSSKEHISILMRQHLCLEKLKMGSEQVKKVVKDKTKSKLLEFLNTPHVITDLVNVTSPLNPSFRCRSVKKEKCKVMDSKMRPILFQYENIDPSGEDINIIFKNGDDLRQDMLTLQMLRIMDRIWKSYGHDFRLNTYGCISMDRRLGMIEVVLDSETIANIQKEKGKFAATAAFQKTSLYSWLKDHNSTDELLLKACNEFTLSCAGYCVATYVLGVADRHSDNIMVKKNGQLFHIDFGHILGHFKEKFGIRRERVPFVLTHDFVYVINLGRSDKEADEFKKFQQLCEKAFMILRKHGTLILSLFAMMISTGLPELSSDKDLNYLRETLVLDLTEDEALRHFRSKFDEALQNSWKTSLNWFSHNISRNNNK
ncbi:unnamed protein product [Chironomus riparius]|uniref:phosphatidylinositol 3-kinase n=1 Tax=Chironomus riparius TaxID=315576 RepID=A0A9N9RR97_9DIPT|nr:unnamed protein product [Chironomus riparius]